VNERVKEKKDKTICTISLRIRAQRGILGLGKLLYCMDTQKNFSGQGKVKF
jgi:hypothetical protein